MKRIFFVLFLPFFYVTSNSQVITDTIQQLFKGTLNGEAIREKFISGAYGRRSADKPWLFAFFSNKLTITRQLPEEKIREISLLKNDSSFSRKRSYYEVLPNFDSSAVIMTAYRISRKNAGDFEFRVLENRQKELLPWSPVKLFCDSYVQYTGKEDEPEIAYLGEFKTIFGNNITVDLRKKGSSEILASMTILWVNRRPEVLGVFSNNELPELLTVFKRLSQNEILYGLTPEERMSKDSLLVLKRVFPSNENSLLFYLDDKVRSRDIIEYRLEGPGKTQDWKANDFDLNLVWLRNLPPGQYKLLVRYSIQRHNVTAYEFEIKPAWHQTTAFKVIAGSLIAAFFCFIILLFKTRKQRLNLKNEQLQRELAQTGSKAIRSQLNPHFIFNSLSSIQGLINKNDLHAANHYLAEFSNLMRNTLITSDKEFIPLSAELSTIESYVKLEQLRFGFSYSIIADGSVNPAETEVPSLLLQPLIENAVKHGIAGMEEKGRIEIMVKREEKDLLISIADNGKGFPHTAADNGYGLKLTGTRIGLLNKILKEQLIQFNFDKDHSHGTIVNLIFKNWF